MQETQLESPYHTPIHGETELTPPGNPDSYKGQIGAKSVFLPLAQHPLLSAHSVTAYLCMPLWIWGITGS